MLGGLICNLDYGSEQIVVHVRGVGPYSDSITCVILEPVNYRMRVGDLIWWKANTVRWEDKVLAVAKDLPVMR